jgi:hypothetical protein
MVPLTVVIISMLIFSIIGFVIGVKLGYPRRVH